MITDLLNRPELALAATLAVALLWVGLAFWLKVRPVGDEVSARLDALQPIYEMTDLAPDVHRPAQAAPAPGLLPRVVMPNIFEQLCQELGVTP